MAYFCISADLNEKIFLINYACKGNTFVGSNGGMGTVDLQ